MRTVSRLFVIVLCCVAARAWADKGQSELSIEPGIAIPIGTTNDYAGNSFDLEGSHFYNFHEVAAFGWEAGYAFNSQLSGTLPTKIASTVSSMPNPGNLNFSSDMSMSILHITPEFKFGPTIPLAVAKLEPFLIGGGGLYWTHYQSGTLTISGTLPNGSTLDHSAFAYDGGNDFNGGFNIGGGMTVEFQQHWAFGGEIRYHHIYYGRGVNDTSYIVPSLKLTLLF